MPLADGQVAFKGMVVRILRVLSWPEHAFNLDSHRLQLNGEVTRLYAPQSCSVTFSEFRPLQSTAIAGGKLVLRTLGY